MTNESLSANLNPLIHLLQGYPTEGELSHVVALAAAKIKHKEVTAVSTGTGTTSSTEIVNIYTLRKQMNYFLGKNTQGIDETLKSLSTHERRITLRCITMQDSLIALWIESDQTQLCGVMIFSTENVNNLGSS